MGSGSVSSCRCCMFVSYVHPVTVLNAAFCMTYILSVYSPFSDRVGLPPHNAYFPGVLMKSTGAAFLRPDGFPDVNHHMRGMQYQIVLNITF